MRRVLENRAFAAYLIGCAAGCYLFLRYPFPQASILDLIWIYKPHIYWTIRGLYTVMLFTTPGLCAAAVLGFAYVFLLPAKRALTYHPLPRYVPVAERNKLYYTLGEIHKREEKEPAEHPDWRVIPERGLFTGIAAVGAIGGGKTSGVMYTAADQIFGYAATDPAKKCGGLVLEVKGDFCYQVKAILERYGRAVDYLEINLTSDIRYNPLREHSDPYDAAYSIALLIAAVFGKSREPFWAMAYTDLCKTIILLHQILYDYCTLLDIFRCMLDRELVEERFREADLALVNQYACVPKEHFLEDEKGEALDKYKWEDAPPDHFKAPLTPALSQLLKKLKIQPEILTVQKDGDNIEERREKLEAAKRSYAHYKTLDKRLSTAIEEGLKIFLSAFDDNLQLRRNFCPPKEIFGPENADRHLGTPFPSFSEIIESGKVVCFNFPAALNPGISRIIGTLVKLDFERAMLQRIPKMTDQGKGFRPCLLLCDEYQMFATAGEEQPMGDEKFFAQSRQAKCVPIVATQSLSSLKSTLPGESWRALLQTFRNKVFLCTTDSFTAKEAAELCGREYKLKPSYGVNESAHDANVSVVTGKATSEKSHLSVSTNLTYHHVYSFEPKMFTELSNCEAIVLTYDGRTPQPATLCYLKPHYLPVDVSYFEQVKRGMLDE